MRGLIRQELSKAGEIRGHRAVCAHTRTSGWSNDSVDRGYTCLCYCHQSKIHRGDLGTNTVDWENTYRQVARATTVVLLAWTRASRSQVLCEPLYAACHLLEAPRHLRT